MLYRAISLFLLLVSFNASAATWYVDCSSGVNGAGTSFSVPFNTTSSLNWTTIGAGDDDVLFKAGTTCTNSQLGGGSGFPNALGVAGSSGDYIRIGVYNATTGAEILNPTSAEKVTLAGDGTTRTEMVSLFGFSYTVLNGFKCSGGSNSSQRGCIAIGANGVTPPTDIFITNNEITQGLTPTNTGSMYGISVAGTSSGATGARITISGNTISGLQGTSNAVGILCSNLDTCTISNNVIDATGFVAPLEAGIWIRSTVDARAVLTGHTVTGNTVTGGSQGFRYNADYTLGASLPYITGLTLTGNTFTDQVTIGANGGHGVYSGLLRASRIEYNTIMRAGLTTGNGSGVYVAAVGGGYVGGSDTQGTSISHNKIQGSGQFAIWLPGISNFIVEDNDITGCGYSGSTFSRCIEITRLTTVTYPNFTLTLGATSGTGVSVTSSGSVFAVTDVEKIISGWSANDGALRITSFTSATQVTGDIIVPFDSTTVDPTTWGFNIIGCQGVVRGNRISGAVAAFSNGGGTEGLGVGLDDLTCKTVVEQNWIANNSFSGINVGNGNGNIIRNNIFYNNGFGSDGSLERSQRKSAINISYTGTEVYGNTINCNNLPYGIAAENSTTISPVQIANGGTSVYRNNAIINCSIAAIVGNANDTASNNSYFGNARNYTWIPQLSFSSAPTEGNFTDQTLDGASKTTNPQFVEGSNPTTAAGFALKPSSPLLNTGILTSSKRGYGNKYLGNPPNIGAHTSSGNSIRYSFSTPRVN